MSPINQFLKTNEPSIFFQKHNFVEMKRISIFLFIAFIFNNSWANDFTHKARVDSVSKTGFYKIALSPEIISASKPDYSDIRIFDSKHAEIPYILVAEQPATERTGFREYDVIENNYLPELALTRIIVHNSTKSIISTLSLIVRNTEVEKEITLKGSDDQKNWYIIKKNFPVASSAYDGETFRMMVLDFPKSNYAFFELTMNEKKKDPLQVMKVGYFDSEVAKGLYTEIPAPIIKQIDSAKVRKSYISIKFNQTYEISRLKFMLKGPALYLRDCHVGRYVKSHNKLVFDEIGYFELSSKNQPVWEFNKIKTDELTIIIDNSDNAPLQVISLLGFQLNKYLIANLKNGEVYDLFVGNKKLFSPEYDLKYFSDSISAGIAVIKTSHLLRLGQSSVSEKKTIFNKTFLWIVIGIIIVLLAWFSIKLTREMGKETHS